MTIRPGTTENKRLTARRGMALALLLCFFAALILSQALAFAHAGHGHNHDDADSGCTVCALISYARGRLNQAGALARTYVVSAAALRPIFILSAVFTLNRFYTLVHLKTQSNR